MEKIKINKINSKKLLALLLDLGLICSFASCSKTPDKAVSASMYDSQISTQYDDSSYDETELSDAFKEYCKESESFQKNMGDVYPYASYFLRYYGKHFNKRKVMSDLKHLKFKVKELDDGNEFVYAQYNAITNTINISPRLLQLSSSEITQVKLHEFVHFLFQKGFTMSLDNLGHHGTALEEGMAALIVRESGIYTNTDSYEKEHYYLRTILELIGVDNYMKAASKGDYSKLKGYLSEYCSPSEASDLIKYIDKAVLFFQDKGTEYDVKAWDIISKMYQNKHGVSIENSDDLVMKCYSNTLAGTYYDIPGADYSWEATSSKNYFLNKHNYISLYNWSKGDYGVIYLDDNNKAQKNAATLSK